MKISSSSNLNLYEIIKDNNKVELVSNKKLELSHTNDKIEISDEGRQRLASEVVNHATKYFGTTQINESLNNILEDKSPEVKEAVYNIIQSNFINKDNVPNYKERAALLEMGLSQAEFIANNYMNENEAKDFMSTIKQIAAISKTGEVDVKTGIVSYYTPPERPVGAPKDYINPEELMKRFEPETYKKFADAVINKGDWASILINFAKRASTNLDWSKKFREESNKKMEALENSITQNRFESVSKNSLEDFSKGMKLSILNAGFTSTDFMSKNMDAFIRIIKGNK
jgi:hypothetical protein